jgi:hypothetical protein
MEHRHYLLGPLAPRLPSLIPKGFLTDFRIHYAIETTLARRARDYLCVIGALQQSVPADVGSPVDVSRIADSSHHSRIVSLRTTIQLQCIS